MEVNHETMESLGVKIRTLSDSLRQPFAVGDFSERKREEERESQLEQWACILHGLEQSLTNVDCQDIARA